MTYTRDVFHTCTTLTRVNSTPNHPHCRTVLCITSQPAHSPCPILHTIYTLYTHYIHTIYPLYTHYIHTIYTLYTVYIHTIYTLYTHYIQSIYTLYTHYIHTIYSLYTHLSLLYHEYSESRNHLYDVIRQRIFSIINSIDYYRWAAKYERYTYVQ